MKPFPRQTSQPTWEEVKLSNEEEHETEKQARFNHKKIMDVALEDSRELAIKHGVNTESAVAQMAIAFFEKRSSHVVYWKERKAHSKFEEKNKKI